jgi:hypothetical protein
MSREIRFCAVPAQVPESGRVRGDVFARELGEGFGAQVPGERFVVLAQRFRQAKTVGIVVDAQPGAPECFVAGDLVADGFVAPEYEILEQRFRGMQAAHAAALCCKAPAATSRAWSSSATMSASGELIVALNVETGPS